MSQSTETPEVLPVISHASPNTTEQAVYDRYADAASKKEAALCCPVQYNTDYLRVIPNEILERDYGCGDPTPFVQPGETVVDLGAGGGKICYILSQVVGAEGRVIGVDCNQEMLALARQHQRSVAEKIGYSNIEFRCGMIQDLRLDLDRLADGLSQRPVSDQDSWLALRSLEDQLRNERPLVADETVDCVVSNCVLNLVRREDRHQLFAEIFRVLRRGGRAAISDIVADEDVPPHLQQNPQLWSGCVSGAFREDEFLQAFERAGFHGIELARREATPWRVVEGIEFRSVTVVAHKGKQGPCLERNQALIYRGPFRQVADDDGHAFRRGERAAVCDKTFHLLQQAPYEGMFDAVSPHTEVPLEDAGLFACDRTQVRSPRETKGRDFQFTIAPTNDCCSDAGECC